MKKKLYAQFGHPSGLLGSLVGWIMATRGSNKKRNEWTVSLLEVGPSDQVLELGYGPGVAIDLVASHLDTGNVVGIDHSAVMRDQAFRRNRHWVDAGRVKLCEGGTELLSRVGKFNKIFSINFMQFAKDRMQLLEQLRNLLHADGILMTTFQPRQRGASAADAERFARDLALDMETLGFTSIRIECLPLTPAPAICVIGQRG